MRNIQLSDIDITITAAVVLSLISLPYLDWWGLLVGPAMVLMFVWAYYSMVIVVLVGGAIKKLTGRA